MDFKEKFEELFADFKKELDGKEITMKNGSTHKITAVRTSIHNGIFDSMCVFDDNDTKVYSLYTLIKCNLGYFEEDFQNNVNDYLEQCDNFAIATGEERFQYVVQRYKDECQAEKERLKAKQEQVKQRRQAFTEVQEAKKKEGSN